METQNNPIFYTHHPQPPSSTFRLNLHPQSHNDSHELEQAFIYTETTTTGLYLFATEPMFQKVLTPSDVGKLNRLVIPKQHAEKYFPLGGGGGGAIHQQRGLLLSFEDESGKLWRFRYSYWSSSQSYVLTKGWRRYVKEKRLDAGDLVLFERHRLDYERMFIGWRRRCVSAIHDRIATEAPPGIGGAQINMWNNVVFDAGESHYPLHHLPISIPLPYHPHYLHADGVMCENVVNYRSGVVATRQLRLFGVNLDCPDDFKPQNLDFSSHCGQSDHQ